MADSREKILKRNKGTFLYHVNKLHLLAEQALQWILGHHENVFILKYILQGLKN